MSRHRREVSVPEAETLMLDAAAGVMRTERLALSSAADRVLAADVVATMDVPPFDRAAMDGYAVIAADTDAAAADGPAQLECVEHGFAGHGPARRLAHGRFSAVATGAPMPAAADAVVMVEHTCADGAAITVFAPATSGQHVGKKGADIHAGETVARAGTWLSPGRVGALAAIGMSDVEVYAQPRVVIVSTGHELVEPGCPIAASQLYDVNGYALAALATTHGAVASRHGTAADTPDEVARALDDACRDADLVVFSGGTSVGAHDFIVEGIAARGSVVFAGIAVKPGKSTAFGVVDGIPVLALPGYPAACLLNAYVLLVPLLRRIARLPHRPRHVFAPLSRRVTSPRDKHHFSTVRLEDGLAVPVFKKASDVTSISDADGYIVLPPGIDALDAETTVDVTLF